MAACGKAPDQPAAPDSCNILYDNCTHIRLRGGPIDVFPATRIVSAGFLLVENHQPQARPRSLPLAAAVQQISTSTTANNDLLTSFLIFICKEWGQSRL
jgi:hypothetical protein